MGLLSRLISVSSQRPESFVGFYKAIAPGGRLSYYGHNCPKCHGFNQSERTSGGDWRFFHCGKIHSYPFSELNSAVRRTVQIGGAPVIFLEDMDEDRLAAPWVTMRQPRSAKDSWLRKTLDEIFPGWDDDNRE